MTQAKIRLQEVALASGYSIGTVSRVMSNPERLSASTVAHVRAVIDRLGYRPNVMARALRMGVSQTIHVITPSLVSLYPEIIRGIESAALELGYSVVIIHTDRDAGRERRHLSDVAAGRGDGALLLATAIPDGVVTGAGQFPPAVSVLQKVIHPAVPSVWMDNVHSGKLATQHLLELGHRRIVHICGDADDPLARQRRQGFVLAMEAAGLQPHWVESGFTPEAGQYSMAKLLQGPDRPTAVFAANDEIAVGVLAAMRDAGLRAPNDISVIGHDDQRLSRIYDPAISTVRVPAFEIGRQAMAKLRAVMMKEPSRDDVVFAAQVVARSSTAGPPA